MFSVSNSPKMKIIGCNKIIISSVPKHVHVRAVLASSCRLISNQESESGKAAEVLPGLQSVSESLKLPLV